MVSVCPKFVNLEPKCKDLRFLGTPTQCATACWETSGRENMRSGKSYNRCAKLPCNNAHEERTSEEIIAWGAWAQPMGQTTIQAKADGHNEGFAME